MKKILLLFVLLLIIHEVNALPPLPNEFYGKAKYFNSNISQGFTIIAYTNGVQCGKFVTSVIGSYGSMSCLANDTEITGTQGGTINSNVTFTVNGQNATAFGDTNFTTGQFSFVNLTVPQLVCGDLFCDATYELCNVCTIDCGKCPSNQTNGTGGGGGSSGNNTGGSGGGGSGSGANNNTNSVTGLATGDMLTSDYCTEEWFCEDWESCRIDNLQTRKCIDANNCGTSDNLPEQIQSCEYFPTCFDEIQNGLETGIDCGGPCKACNLCSNGIMDGNETGVDCGGSCGPCPTCTDGTRNQGEEGVDCGGPCPNACPVTIQRPGFVCTKDLGPFNIIFWFIIAAVMLSDVLAYAIYKVKESYVRGNKKLDDFQKAAKIYLYKRNSFIYIIATLIVTAMLLLYYWFIGVCENLNIKYLWILGILFVAAYFIINYLIMLFEQNERKTLKLAKLTGDAHYKNINEMIAFYKKKLSELVVEISNILRLLLKDSEFAQEIIANEDFKKVYQDILLITSKKLDINKWDSQEDTNIAEDLKQKLDQETVQNVTKKHPQFEALTRRIQTLVEQYDELKKLSEEKKEMERNTIKETPDANETGTETKKEETEEKPNEKA